MKIQTNVHAGLKPGQCHRVYNRYGRCKKIVCPYPPFKFPCYRSDLLKPGPGPFFTDSMEVETEE